MKPKIFIGSSSGGKRIVNALQTTLENAGYEYDISPWFLGVFNLSSTNIEALEKQLDNSDFAILVLTPDDITTKKGELKVTPRDNVILELGLFIGRLGRKRTYVICEKNVEIELPSDLLGITVGYFSNSSDDSELLNKLNSLSYTIHSAISDVFSDNYLFSDLRKSAERIISKKQPMFSNALDDSVYSFIPRILQLLCDDEYCTKYERKVVITPDEGGKQFKIETSTVMTLHTNKNCYGNTNPSWYSSEENRDNIKHIKFSIDGEDLLTEYNSSRELLFRTKRDHYSPYGEIRKPIQYQTNQQSHIIESEIENTRQGDGFHRTHTMFERLAKNISITLQLSGPYASKWALSVFPFTAFKYSTSPYSDEYSQKNTTLQNCQIDFRGWALPGWGYNCLVCPIPIERENL